MTDKKLKLPEAGQWPDKLVVPALIAGAVLSTVGFLMAFFYVAPVGGAAVNGAELIGDVMVSQKMLLSQKIFYFHMPVAITSFIALGFGCYYAVRFLMTKNQRFDTCSRICLEIALLFVVLTMITGEMWTRFEWGVWWSWEPRLTTYLILMLIVIAYFVLRSSVDEPERRATFAAVVAIIATIDVPICFMITRLIPSSIHPVVLREGGMSPEMGMCVGLCALGMLLVGFVLYRTRFNQVRLTHALKALSKEPSTTGIGLKWQYRRAEKRNQDPPLTERSNTWRSKISCRCLFHYPALCPLQPLGCAGWWLCSCACSQFRGTRRRYARNHSRRPSPISRRKARGEGRAAPATLKLHRAPGRWGLRPGERA